MASVATVGAWGHTTHGGKKQIAVRLPEPLWSRLKMRAIKDGCSMAFKIEQYVEVGICVDDDWDEDEPGRKI